MIIHHLIEKKHFCFYFLQAFSTEEILKRSIKEYFKLNGKQRIIMPKNLNMVNSKIMKRKQRHHL